jgi:hypothetical protein
MRRAGGPLDASDRHLENAVDHDAVFEHVIVFQVRADRRAFKDYKYKPGKRFIAIMTSAP